jgi:hypothetical protein
MHFFIGGHLNEYAYYVIVRPAAAMTVVLFPSLPALIAIVEMIAIAQLLQCSERTRTTPAIKSRETGLMNAVLGLGALSFCRSLKRVISQRLGLPISNNATLGFFFVGNVWHGEQSPVPLRSSKLVERLGAVTMLCVVDDEVIFEPFSVPETVFFKGASSNKSLKLYQSNSGFGFEDPSWWQSMPSLKPIGLCAMVAATKMGSLEDDDETALLHQESPSHMRKALVDHIRHSPPAEDGPLGGSDYSRDDQHHVDLALELGFSGEDLSIFSEKWRVHVLNRNNSRGFADAADGHDDTYSQEDSWRRGYVHPVSKRHVLCCLHKIYS